MIRLGIFLEIWAKLIYSTLDSKQTPMCFTFLHKYVSLIVCGVEKTGQVVIFNRAALYQAEVEQPVLPQERLQVTKEGASVTCLDLDEELMVTGSSDGNVCLYNLETGQMLERLSQGGSLVYQVKLKGRRVLATAGSKITVHTITTQGEGDKLTTSLSHLLEGRLTVLHSEV